MHSKFTGNITRTTSNTLCLQGRIFSCVSFGNIGCYLRMRQLTDQFQTTCYLFSTVCLVSHLHTEQRANLDVNKSKQKETAIQKEKNLICSASPTQIPPTCTHLYKWFTVLNSEIHTPLTTCHVIFFFFLWFHDAVFHLTAVILIISLRTLSREFQTSLILSLQRHLVMGGIPVRNNPRPDSKT